MLKQLSEGGGNLVLANFSSYSDRERYFLMRKIDSPRFKGAVSGSAGVQELVCEVGVFGCLVSVQGEIVVNRPAGYISRSKFSGSAECGVSCGHGFLDSIKTCHDRTQ